MITNLFRPWIFSRVTSGLCVALLMSYGTWIALRVLRQWQATERDARQLRLERKAELVASIVSAAVIVSILNLALSIFGAERLSLSIEGAMCGFGVFDANPWGFRSLTLSLLCALSCAQWLLFHRFEIELRDTTYTPRKFLLVLPLSALIWMEFTATLSFFLQLDLSAHASCCSLGFSELVAPILPGGEGNPSSLTIAIFFGSGIASVLTHSLVLRRPRSGLNYLAGACTLSGAITALPTIVQWVAPHAYQDPQHLCPFCLLKDEFSPLGWLILVTLFVSTTAGLAPAILESTAAKLDDTQRLRHHQVRLSRAAVLSWALLMAACAWPPLHWYLESGGSTLFS